MTAESRKVLDDFLKNMSPKKGTTVIEIPSIVEIESRGKIGKVGNGYGYYVPRKEDDVISAEMAETFKIANSDFKNILMMVLPFAPIFVASKEDLLKLVAYPVPFCKISLYQSDVPVKQLSLDTDEKKLTTSGVSTLFKPGYMKADDTASVTIGVGALSFNR
jgi:hypothetical protein